MRVKSISNSKIVSITNTHLGTNFENYTDLEDKMFDVKNRLHGQWVTSATSDFSVYNDPEYVYEGIHCYEKSKSCVAGAVRFFGKEAPGNVVNGHMIDVKTTEGIWYSGKPLVELEILDVYNGVGLTTAQLALSGCLFVESFNDCEAQVQFMHATTKHLGVPRILNHTTMPKKKYDVVMSFEVLEHYPRPLEHVRLLLELTKPGGYVAESSGFNGSSENIGHFDVYDIDGKEVGYRQARRLVTAEFKKHFERVHRGFNSMPVIWKRK